MILDITHENSNQNYKNKALQARKEVFKMLITTLRQQFKQEIKEVQIEQKEAMKQLQGLDKQSQKQLSHFANNLIKKNAQKKEIQNSILNAERQCRQFGRLCKQSTQVDNDYQMSQILNMQKQRDHLMLQIAQQSLNNNIIDENNKQNQSKNNRESQSFDFN